MKRFSLRFGALLLLLGVIGGINPATVRAEDSFQIRYFDLTEGRLAFSYANGETKDIYVLDFQDLSVTPLVTSPALDEAPNWSPDGQKLVFHSDMSGDREIYSINADGTGMKRLTVSKGLDEHPSYSPDGRRIVFQSSRRVEGSEIFEMDADGGNPHALVSNPAEREQTRNVTPRFSPRGDEVSYVTDAQWPGWDIVIYSLQTKTPLTLTHGIGSYIRPGWKPDGGSFVFSYGSGNLMNIWEIAKGTNQPHPLLEGSGKKVDPCWNENGTLLFFSAEETPGSNDFQLKVFDQKTAQTVAVLKSDGAVRHAAWTPLPSVASLVADIRRTQSKSSSTDKPSAGTGHEAR